MAAMVLAALRDRVADARVGGGEPLALALVELAEAEPVLGHRQTVVRPLLEEAAAVLDPLGVRALEGRVLLRLAAVKLSERDLEGAEQLATRARERLLASGDRWRVLECGTVLARSAIRRDDLAGADRLLGELARGDEPDPVEPAAHRAVAALALAYSEIALEQRNYAGADQRLAVLASGIDGEADLIEARYECHQMRAAVALARGTVDKACHELREVVELAKTAGSIHDELESRIALAGALVERADAIGREEAEKHLQITRDKAQEHGLDSLHMAALVGQAGVLAKRGQTQAALDRCVEIANAAVAKQDLPRYAAAVALMSQIYEQKGDLASAYRTFAEANAALREQIGPAAKDVIRPHLAAFAERIGRDTFQEIAERVTRAAEARAAFRRL
jgi:tetratricopeptide (TPR) repeat protein